MNEIQRRVSVREFMGRNFVMDKRDCLRDNAAASAPAATTVGVDGGGGCGLRLGGLGGDGEECSEEIH